MCPCGILWETSRDGVQVTMVYAYTTNGIPDIQLRKVCRKCP